MKWIWENDKANECSERTRRERTEQDDADTRAGANTWDVAESEAGLQGHVAMETVSMEQCVHNTAHRASIHSTPYWHGHEADRTTDESTDGTNRTGTSAGTAGKTEEGQCESAWTGMEAPAGRAPGSVAFSARSRENSREEVFENNKTVKTDEERSGWWGALKKRFYRDMG